MIRCGELSNTALKIGQYSNLKSLRIYNCELTGNLEKIANGKLTNLSALVLSYVGLKDTDLETLARGNTTKLTYLDITGNTKTTLAGHLALVRGNFVLEKLYTHTRFNANELNHILDLWSEADIVEKRLAYYYDTRPYHVAKYFLNEKLLNGAIDPSMKTAVKFLRQDLERSPDHQDALIDMALIHRIGGGGIEADVNKSLELFVQASNIKSNNNVHFQLAYSHLGCFGVKVDEKEACKYFQVLGRNAELIAMVYVAFFKLFDGENDAFNEVQALTNRNVAIAIYQTGTMLLKGDQCKQDIDSGLR